MIAAKATYFEVASIRFICDPSRMLRIRKILWLRLGYANGGPLTKINLPDPRDAGLNTSHRLGTGYAA